MTPIEKLRKIRKMCKSIDSENILQVTDIEVPSLCDALELAIETLKELKLKARDAETYNMTLYRLNKIEEILSDEKE